MRARVVGYLLRSVNRCKSADVEHASMQRVAAANQAHSPNAHADLLLHDALAIACALVPFSAVP
jgi:pyrroloquinoline quinone (PQQ) biosynthesis protein C